MAKIVYIAGYGHSGSTLYGIILGHGPGRLNLGEAYRFSRFEKRPHIRRPALNAKFEPLLGGLRQIVAKFEGDLAEISRFESSPAATRCGVQDSSKRYNGFWEEVFHLVSKDTGADVFVDSSKTARGCLQRPLLLRNAGHDVYLLHLVKDPRALVFSRWKKKGARNGLKSLLMWLVTNWETQRLYKKWGVRYRVSFYDDFAVDPDSELQNLGRFIGEDLSPNGAHLKSGKGFDPGLQIGGNSAGRHNKVFWRTSVDWRTEASGLVKLIGAAGLPMLWYLKKL